MRGGLQKWVSAQTRGGGGGGQTAGRVVVVDVVLVPRSPVARCGEEASCREDGWGVGGGGVGGGGGLQLTRISMFSRDLLTNYTRFC